MEKTPVKKGLSRLQKGLISAGASLLVLALAAGGLFLYFDSCYGDAEDSTNGHDFKAAMAALGRVPCFFRDASALMVYAQAGDALQSGQFDSAKAYYGMLGDFRDSGNMILEAGYEQASGVLAKGNYDEAKARFTELASAGYKDSASLMLEADYRKAGGLLEGGDYDSANALYGALAEKGYREAAEMRKETQYRQASLWLANRDFVKAKSAFESLAALNYKDAEGQATEAEYQIAYGYLQNEDYPTAAGLLGALAAANYKDSAQLLKEADYDLAVAAYRQKDYVQAGEMFAALGSYEHSEDYLFLMGIMDKKYSTVDREAMQKLCARLAGLADIDDVGKFLQTDDFIYYWLEGSWKSADGKFYFMLNYDPEAGGWQIEYNLPAFEGSYFKIVDTFLSVGSDKEGWQKCFQFHCTTPGSMTVTCMKGNYTLSLDKQK